MPTGLDTPIGLRACECIAAKVSNATDVYYPGSFSYDADNKHYASSSSQRSSCSVEPGSVEDVGIILRILGKMQTPFGVKGGGHATNPGFSSMTGVQIAMTHFKDVTYDMETWTAVIGASNIWDDVYEALNARGVNILRGRVSGIGVAGFTLGGGYSWHSNQHGLAIDNVVAYELVMPNGIVTTVTASTDLDLFFSLKGGYSNFGIITRFTLKTFPQGNIWGGTTVYPPTVISTFIAAAARFSSDVTDPNGSSTRSHRCARNQLVLATIMMYDGPAPPRDIFDDFLNMANLRLDVKERSFVDLIKSTQQSVMSSLGSRAIYNHIPMSNYSESTIECVIDNLGFWGPTLFAHDPSSSISYALEPFLPDLFSHAPDDSSAYLGSQKHLVLPTNIMLHWALESKDGMFCDVARNTMQKLGILGLPRYLNYTMEDTPLVDMYGEGGLRRMEATRKRVNPKGVMRLTGGFKV
ncbi:uncharacterized protein EV420DRAFT_1306380 [Desarmillaria tabescens]|uniref:FAD-binding PCMH-type domain-containing protein n=1 Tax=Armillaria tabescens TaxID=1929756 RepID=A0AA39N7J1_ARMTA|nr:uncharacterized protein EV420DRAFT_1306380 [Desarmillaria tabescens]KAK0460474.1 hypothetical protein EV420DRAFT_1306380 [Desarmillaria tabescens]